jgi:hypothetical protein
VILKSGSGVKNIFHASYSYKFCRNLYFITSSLNHTRALTTWETGGKALVKG